MTQNNQEIKELVNKIREEIPLPSEPVSQYLEKIEELVSFAPPTEEEKKEWAELGIEAEPEKQKLIREVKKLIELFSSQNNKKINIYFATEKTPQITNNKLQGKNILTEINGEDLSLNIHINLERKDKQNNFCPSLVFWSLTQELTTINHENYDKDPNFWNNFEKQVNWIKDNLSEDYSKEFSQLLNPSTFPHEKLEISELLTIYVLDYVLFTKENQTDWTIAIEAVPKKIINKSWQNIKQELIELSSKELKTNSDEETKKKLALKANIEADPDGQEYIIKVYYYTQNPNQAKIEQLVTKIPLKLEIENLKQEKEQLPNLENFEKLEIENKLLKEYLKDYIGDKKFDVLEEKLKNQN